MNFHAEIIEGYECYGFNFEFLPKKYFLGFEFSRQNVLLLKKYQFRREIFSGQTVLPDFEKNTRKLVKMPNTVESRYSKDFGQQSGVY